MCFPNAKTTCGPNHLIITFPANGQPARWFLRRSRKPSRRTRTISRQWTSRSMKVPRSFLPEFDFYKNHVRMKWTWKCLTFPPKRKLCQLKETTTKNITRCFDWKRVGSPLGLGPMIWRPVSWTQVSDQWPRIITCWESYLKSNGFHQKRIQRWGGHGKDGNGFWRWIKVIDIVLSTMFKKRASKIGGL